MKFTLAVLALATSAYAAPKSLVPRTLPTVSSLLNGLLGSSSTGCISQTYANKLVAEYEAVIAQVNSDLGTPAQTAQLITAYGYQEFSDSANSLSAKPLGSATVPDQNSFVTLSQSSPASVQNTISIYVAGCNQIVWQWVQPNFGNGAYQVNGFHLFYVNSKGQLTKTYFEFNSIAADYDLGGKCTNASGATLTL